VGDITVPASVGGGLVALGAALTAVSLPTLRRERRILRRGIAVTAQVVGVVKHEAEGPEDPIYGGGGDTYYPLVRFRTSDGEATAQGTRTGAYSPRHWKAGKPSGSTTTPPSTSIAWAGPTWPFLRFCRR
jgi:hypothetical protein